MSDCKECERLRHELEHIHQNLVDILKRPEVLDELNLAVEMARVRAAQALQPTQEDKKGGCKSSKCTECRPDETDCTGCEFEEPAQPQEDRPCERCEDSGEVELGLQPDGRMLVGPCPDCQQGHKPKEGGE